MSKIFEYFAYRCVENLLIGALCLFRFQVLRPQVWLHTQKVKLFPTKLSEVSDMYKLISISV